MRKKGLSHKQLVAAGKMADEMLVKKGLQLPTEKSFINKIESTQGAPVLPGTPSYLPRPWTVDVSKRMMFDIVQIWRDQTKKNQVKMMSITDFFRFVVSEMDRLLAGAEKDIKAQAKRIKRDNIKKKETLRDVFEPVRRREVIKSVKRFYIDSFALAVIVKKNDDLPSFIEWFDEWTISLKRLWDKDNAKRST